MNDVNYPEDIKELKELIDKIHFDKTKSYFEEVVKSYKNMDYRSAVMMIWNIVLFDIVEKLYYLVDVYEDQEATTILAKLEEVGKKVPPKNWTEKDLLDELLGKTNIINSIEYKRLFDILAHRHLAAHPIGSIISKTSEDRKIYVPCGDMTKALMIAALESLLIKPPYYSEKVLDHMLSYLSERSDILLDKDAVRSQLMARYLTRIPNDIQLKIYRSLWNLVFRSDDDDHAINRKLNFYALEIIGENNKEDLANEISKDITHFSNIGFNEERMGYLVSHLTNFSELYNLLGNDLQATMSQYVKENINVKLVAHFMQNSLEEHLQFVVDYIDDTGNDINSNVWQSLNKSANTEIEKELFCKVVAHYYTNSTFYDMANYRFSEVVKEYIQFFNINALNYLLERIENNAQTHERRGALKDHIIIYQRIIELDPNFNFAEYRYFYSNVSWSINTTVFIEKPEQGPIVIKNPIDFENMDTKD